jgi:circadian clock protein KaiC
MQYLKAAAHRDQRGAMFIFDEELGLLFSRAKALGIDLEAMCESGKLVVEQMDAAELSPGEFSHRVRRCVDHENISMIAIDSLNGYQASMPEEQFLTLHIHELLQYLNRRGATTFLTLAQTGMVGEMKQPVDLTYLADNVIMLRYFEAAGRVRRSISMIKKRGGSHEDTFMNFASAAAASPSAFRSNSFRGCCVASRPLSAKAQPSWRPLEQSVKFSGGLRLDHGSAGARCSRRLPNSS